MKFTWSFLVFFCGFSLLAPLHAQNDEAQEIAELKVQIMQLAERLSQLEQSRLNDQVLIDSSENEQALVAETPPPMIPAQSDKVRLAGDLRYRHESIWDDLYTDRHRHRIRARMSVTADVAEDTIAVFGLSTGPRTKDSGNQTFDEGFSYKPVGVDLAYFNWGVTEDLNIFGGKMPSPFFRPTSYHLIYDSDIRPEGVAAKYQSGSFFSNASAFWVEERSDSSDSMLYGLQAGYRGDLNNGMGLTAGISYYETSNMKGRKPIFTPDNGQGNQLDINGNYLYGFSEFNIFSELRFQVGGKPATFFADYVRNREAKAFDDGYATGITYGSTSNPGNWSLAYVYQDSGANAVIGAFSDSDFAGGTSDGRAHTFRAGYAFYNGWNFGVRYVTGERGEAAGKNRDYDRLMADVLFRY